MIGPSGLRFNPTQQKDGFATDFSYGYRIIAILRYDNVFPGISFEPTIIWAHDLDGIAPGPGENFVEGRKNLITNVEMRFAQENVHVAVTGDLGWVVLVEQIASRHPDGAGSGRVQATNLFERVDGRWYLVHHHGSPIYEESPRPRGPLH